MSGDGMARRTFTGLRRGGALALDLLLPPVCLNCAGGVSRQGELCASCWREVNFLAPPWCRICGRPFEFSAAGDGAAVCGDCARRRPVYERARAAMIYDDASRDLVLKFKHADRTEAAPAFGRWLGRAGAELLSEVEVIAVVPLHPLRLLRRRYNQAALLAAALVRAAAPAETQFWPDLLRRIRRTPSQGGLNRSERARNVRRAFAVDRAYLTRLPGRRVLLLDDVMTTGATAESCSRCLYRAGAAAVDVLTLARVVRAEV